MRRVTGGLLMQDRDTDPERADMEVGDEREPTEEEWGELLFAWKVCKHVRSNAIVIAKDGATIGIGAGQMSRVDSVRIAVEKARRPREDAEPCWPARPSPPTPSSPSPTAPRPAIDAGVTAIIQPGGSKRDAEVIEACDSAGVAMVFTGAGTSGTSRPSGTGAYPGYCSRR